jgi:hypothetical protein
MFKVNEKVVLVGTGTNNLLLEIVDHMYSPNMYRVKIIDTGQLGPVYKNDIRHATRRNCSNHRTNHIDEPNEMDDE